jgi:hypothetical protein
MENRHQRLKVLRDYLRASRTALRSAPISNTFRGANPMGRHNSLSGGDPRQTTHLVASHRSGQEENLLCPLLKKRSELSIRNGILIYKQLIRPVMDYPCSAWRSAARSHVRRLQVLQSKCLRLVTGAPYTYVTGRFTRIWVFHYSPTTPGP